MIQPSLLRFKAVGLIILPIVLFVVSLTVGRYPVAPGTALAIVFAKLTHSASNAAPTLQTVVWDIRVPRTLLAMAIGASLAISGASFQGLFRNPLVSPDILGVSAAAGFGAALAILFSSDATLIRVMALVFGLLGVGATYLISRVYQTTPTLVLVLAGVVVSTLCTALISFVKYVADPFEKLPTITFWLLGSLSSASLANLVFSLPLMALGIAGLLLVRWQMNILSLGEADARTLGIPVERLQLIIVVCATVVTATAVAASGIIGWVGLVIPHIGRMLVGPDHRLLLPTVVSVGACYLLVVDDIARTATVSEIPIGILTALIGAPFFIYLIRRTKGGWAA